MRLRLIVNFIVVLLLHCMHMAPLRNSHKNIEKRHTGNKFMHTVPITFKDEFVCSGSFISFEYVLSSAECIKMGPAEQYKVLLTDGPISSENGEENKKCSVQKLYSQDQKMGLGLLHLKNAEKTAPLVLWDKTGTFKPWLTGDIVNVVGWEGSDYDSDEYYSDEEYEDQSGESAYFLGDQGEQGEEYDDYDEYDEYEEYEEYENDRFLAPYPVVTDKHCRSARNDDRVFCSTPQQQVFCDGFLGGGVIASDGRQIGVITDVSKCNRLVAVRTSSSAAWIQKIMQNNTSRVKITQQDISQAEPTQRPSRILALALLVSTPLICAFFK